MGKNNVVLPTDNTITDNGLVTSLVDVFRANTAQYTDASGWLTNFTEDFNPETKAFYIRKPVVGKINTGADAKTCAPVYGAPGCNTGEYLKIGVTMPWSFSEAIGRCDESGLRSPNQQARISAIVESTNSELGRTKFEFAAQSLVKATGLTTVSTPATVTSKVSQLLALAEKMDSEPRMIKNYDGKSKKVVVVPTSFYYALLQDEKFKGCMGLPDANLQGNLPLAKLAGFDEIHHNPYIDTAYAYYYGNVGSATGCEFDPLLNDPNGDKFFYYVGAGELGFGIIEPSQVFKLAAAAK